MKKQLTTLILAILSLTMMAQAPAFPGAEGHGRYVTGGRGGKVVHVTNLNDSGAGSFRQAVSGTDKKIVVFDVGGVIPLSKDVTIGANTTILGQTAPAPGITLRYYTLRPNGNNIVMRYIRVRRGQEKDVNDGADATWCRNFTGIIIDHCSFSWSIDEVASFYDNNNFTMQWCTIGESLNNAGHGKGAHGYGGIWGGKLASFHHNLICHVNNRSPRFNGARYDWTGYASNYLYSDYQWQNAVQAEIVDFRNCVVYNCGNGCYGGPGGGYVNMVNNYYKTGPAASTSRVTNISIANSTSSSDDKKYWDMTSRYYIRGNQVNNTANYDWQNVAYDSGVQTINGERYTLDPNHYYGDTVGYVKNSSGKDCVRIRLNGPVDAGNVTTHVAATAFDKVLTYAGASLSRDDVDTRYEEEARKGTATYSGSVTKKPGRIDLVSDVNGYTENNFGTGSRPAGFDTDRDGIPDAWETANGLNPNNAADALVSTIDPEKYYTNLEVYANALVQDIMLSGNGDAQQAVADYCPAYTREDGTRVAAVNQPQQQQLDGVAAKVVWPLDDVDNYSLPSTVEPATAFSLNTVSVGDFTVTVGAPDNSEGVPNAGVKMLKLQPTGGDNTSVEFIVKPAQGITFTPTHVYARVARFGTDGGTLNVSVHNEEGQKATLASGLIPARNNKTTAQDAKGSDPNYCWEFSFDVPATLATGQGFSLVVTESGLSTSKQWGIGDVHVEGVVDGSAQQVDRYSLQLLASPEQGGTVSVYPQGQTFDEGTELRLTATKSFGYRFVNWTDAAGAVVSTEPVFSYVLKSDARLTANFTPVNTYELDYAVDGGANLYQVLPSPAPTVRNGKNMYEEGTEVTLTASGNAILTFNSWSTGETNSELRLVMDKDRAVVAHFSAIDYVVGWDFYLPGNNGRVADFYSTSDNDYAQLVLVDEQGNTQSWLDKCTQTQGGYESMAGAAVNWKKLGEYHFQTKVNARDFTNIRVKSQLLYNYNAYTHVRLQWSLDGKQWTTAGEVTMPAAKTVTDCDFPLPAAADHAETLYLRWMPDLGSSVDGSNDPEHDGTAISNIFILGDAAVYDDGKAPVLLSTVPADGATNASATGRVVLNFDERVTVSSDAYATMSYSKGEGELTNSITEDVTMQATGKTVVIEYQNLPYGQPVVLRVLEGISDMTGNAYPEVITLKFTVMSKPAVQKALYDFVVPDDGSFTDALAKAAARSDKSRRFRIFVKQGDYVIPANGQKMVEGNDGKQYPDPKTSFGSPNVSIIGEGMSVTSIANQMPGDLSANPNAGAGGMANPLEGIRTSGLLYLTSGAQNTYFQDITLKTNTPDNTGRNVVLVDGSNHTICKDVCLWAYQDTYVSDNPRSTYYFEGGLLRGRTDFLCGSGDVFYNQVTLQMCEDGGYLAVPRDNVKYGYVFKDCTIRGEKSSVNGRYYLGRPWTKGAEVYYIDTRMEAIPYAEGWHNMSDDGCTRMAEWNSTSASGNPIDLSGRTTVLGGNPNDPWLTAEEAAEIGDMSNMFGDWNPRLSTEQAPLPQHLTLDGNVLSWDDSDYALCWAVVKNGRVVAFTTQPSYHVDDTSAQWAVRAANEMGGLGQAVVLGASEGVSAAVAAPDSSSVLYNLQGMRVTGARQGVYISNGRKVVVR